LNPCKAIITPAGLWVGSHTLNGNSVLSKEVKMGPLMVGMATSGARGALNFGEQAVSRMIMQIGSK
jgi:hypothetical protein